jgi:Flp pilus assembly protein TadD
VQYRAGHLEQARAALQQAVQGLPDSPDLNYHLGMILYRLGDAAAARAALEKAVKGSASYPGRDEAEATLAALAKPAATEGSRQ